MTSVRKSRTNASQDLKNTPREEEGTADNMWGTDHRPYFSLPCTVEDGEDRENHE